MADIKEIYIWGYEENEVGICPFCTEILGRLLTYIVQDKEYLEFRVIPSNLKIDEIAAMLRSNRIPLPIIRIDELVLISPTSYKPEALKLYLDTILKTRYTIK